MLEIDSLQYEHLWSVMTIFKGQRELQFRLIHQSLNQKKIPHADSQPPVASFAQKGASIAVGPGALSVAGQGSEKPREMGSGIKKIQML